MSDEVLHFIVPGVPQSKGRARHAIMRAGNRVFSRTYTPAATEEAENLFAARAMMFKPAKPFEGPLMLMVGCFFPPPASWSKKRRAETQWHTAKPDADNVLKLVKDALNGVFWIDDRQVCHVTVTKLYDSEYPRTEVTISPLKPFEEYAQPQAR